MSIFGRLFTKKDKVIDFYQDSSWMLNPDLSVNEKNVRRSAEFVRLRDTKHSERWHKEGNPLKHTLLVCNKMHEFINNELKDFSERDKRIMMLAALCHDLGKATTTYYDETEKDWKCRNHGAEGEKITRNMLFNEPDYMVREEVCWLVKNHMKFHHFVDLPDDKKYSVMTNLALGRSSIEKLLWLNVADSYGSKNDENNKEAIDEKFKVVKDIALTCKCFTGSPEKSVKKSDFTMFLMIGVPGCGKDTYIKKFFPDVYVISRDDIREEMTDGQILGRKLYFDNVKEGMVTDIVNERIKKCCEERKSFILNQTNMKKKYREQLKETALKYGRPNVIYVYVEPPSIDECKERRGHGKWDSIIDRMWNDFEMPEKSEYDNMIFYKQTK